jgi:hypothetical protein
LPARICGTELLRSCRSNRRRSLRSMWPKPCQPVGLSSGISQRLTHARSPSAVLRRLSACAIRPGGSSPQHIQLTSCPDSVLLLASEHMATTMIQIWKIPLRSQRDDFLDDPDKVQRARAFCFGEGWVGIGWGIDSVSDGVTDPKVYEETILHASKGALEFGGALHCLT